MVLFAYIVSIKVETCHWMKKKVHKNVSLAHGKQICKFVEKVEMGKNFYFCHLARKLVTIIYIHPVQFKNEKKNFQIFKLYSKTPWHSMC